MNVATLWNCFYRMCMPAAEDLAFQQNTISLVIIIVQLR